MFCERLESNSIGLHDGDRDMTRLAGIDVSHNTAFARVRAADDLALGSVSQTFHSGILLRANIFV